MNQTLATLDAIDITTPVEIEYVSVRFQEVINQRYRKQTPPPDGTDLLNVPQEIVESFDTSFLDPATFQVDCLLMGLILESPGASVELHVGGNTFTPEQIEAS